MENYEQEIAFLESEGLKSVMLLNYYNVVAGQQPETIDFLEVLSKHKTYLIEQGKKGKLIAGGILSDQLYKSECNEIMEIDCHDTKEFWFIYDNVLLSNRIKELEKEVQQHRDNQFIPAAPAEFKIPSKMNGIPDAKFGDTEFDSISVAYGYNLAIEVIVSLNISTTSTKQP